MSLSRLHLTQHVTHELNEGVNACLGFYLLLMLPSGLSTATILSDIPVRMHGMRGAFPGGNRALLILHLCCTCLHDTSDTIKLILCCPPALPASMEAKVQ